MTKNKKIKKRLVQVQLVRALREQRARMCGWQRDKVGQNVPAMGERGGPECRRQDQPLRNTSVPLSSAHRHTPKGIEGGEKKGGGG